MQEMKKDSLRFFALCLVFLSVAIVFYAQGGVSLAKFLLFYASGVASGANLVQGIISLRNAR
jgi:hypothetical protein